MKNVRTYTDVKWSKGLESPWDFVGNPYDDKGNEDIWNIDPNVNDGHPYLTIMFSPPPPPPPLPPEHSSPTTTITSPTQTTYTTILTTSSTTSPTPTTQTLITTTSPITSPTTTSPEITSPTSPFTKPSEQSMDIMNIIGLILVMIAVLVFISAVAFYFRGSKGIEETISKPSILKMEATKLSVDEWDKILVKIKGKGKVSINLEGDVEWIKPEPKEISGESIIEIPVKPKVSGEVPVKIIVDSIYGKESSMMILKVEKKTLPGLDDIIPLRNMPLKNLVTGYGCDNPNRFKVNLSSPTVPKEFEGAWDCCLLGCGGWGCAYLATRGNEKIVIKIPRGHEAIIEGGNEGPTGSQALLKKIRSEAEIMGSLDHTNIIKLLGVSNKHALLIYEFADYGSLYWQQIKGWRPSLKDVVLIGIQLGDALRYIHSRGLIHGDIKPSNVFIKNGIAKLGDFSSMVKLLSSVSITKMPFTFGFRAPEQAYPSIMKKAKELGVENRIDVYQLGNLLLYILTGESIDGEEAKNDKLVMEKLSMVPNEELRAILAEALKLEPDKRPSAEEFTKKLYDIWRKIAQ
jgi:tRNA A-37 threonylcarbamoyl transferase component Bud32/biopolymer transport protein ExbD